MGFGKINKSSTKAISCWIRSMDMGFMIGAMEMCIRANGWRTTATERE